jgi:hypothetical protein
LDAFQSGFVEKNKEIIFIFIFFYPKGGNLHLDDQSWMMKFDLRSALSVQTSFLGVALHPETGLPDFSCYNIPKREKYTKMTIKFTKWPQKIPSIRKIDQTAIK